MPMGGAHGAAVDALGGDALATAALDGVVDAQHHRPARREGVDQMPQQQARRRPGAPDRPAEHPMVVHEVPLPREPGDAQQARHRSSARRADSPDQQHFGVAPTPLKKERRKAQDHRGKAGR
jgi:hypothetical protein